MKKMVISTVITSAAICLLVNWTTQETTIAGNKKQRVNFFGMLETQEGNKYKVENVSIGMIYKQIPLYESPSDASKDHVLKRNPKGAISKIDLSETAKIEVPYPDVIWTYKKKGSHQTKYIEIVVISKDQANTKCNYLVDLNRKVYCDKVNQAGPIEFEIEFQSLKCLTIEGYRYREPECKEKKEQLG